MPAAPLLLSLIHISSDPFPCNMAGYVYQNHSLTDLLMQSTLPLIPVSYTHLLSDILSSNCLFPPAHFTKGVTFLFDISISSFINIVLFYYTERMIFNQRKLSLSVKPRLFIEYKNIFMRLHQCLSLIHIFSYTKSV